MRRDEYFSAVLLKIIISQIWDICDLGTSVTNILKRYSENAAWNNALLLYLTLRSRRRSVLV